MRFSAFAPPVLAFVLLANTGQAAQSDWRRSAERSLATAAEVLAENTNSATAGWQFARACFDLAEFATNSTERAALAQRGIAAARQVIASEPKNAPAHYYLGMNLGQLARTRFLGALKIVGELERAFLRTLELDPDFDHAGPDRNLGLLYRDAPSIGSVGSRRKANQHLQNAVRRAPKYPENRLNLAESLLGWGDRRGAVRELKALEENWDEAKKELSGPYWESSWADWEPRRQKLSERLSESLPGLKSPRDSSAALGSAP
jgi:hypothetical protein